MKRIFSGVQPTGDLHLGNYLGAIKQFVPLQEVAECVFCVVDLHAITLKHDPALLRKHTLEITAAYLACGIDTNKATIFAQSQVSAHAEMAWLLNCVARMGWMERMVQFKDKAGENKERASVGLFTYPILMAADILAYKANVVPVGDDQKQHLNLAADIAKKFNHDFGNVFPIPEAMHSSSARVMSLQDGRAKMSKSDPDPNSRINLSDSNDVIDKKVRKATAYTLPFPANDEELLAIEPDLNCASVANLINLYLALNPQETRESVFESFGGKGYGYFKPALTQSVIDVVAPIRDKMAALMQEPDYLQGVLSFGAQQARDLAAPVLAEAKQKMGFVV